MNKLSTIQKRNNLNQVYVLDEAHPVNKGHHEYQVLLDDRFLPDAERIDILFQKGPRNVEGSIRGILDGDLLEIVKHRMESFQSGPYATRENALVITHLEMALMYMNKRAEDRFEANKLGTNKV